MSHLLSGRVITEERHEDEVADQISRSQVLAYLYEAEKNGLVLQRWDSPVASSKHFVTSDGTEVQVRYMRDGERDSVVVLRDGARIGSL